MKTLNHRTLVLLLAVTAGCSVGESESSQVNDFSTDNLWAGQTTFVMSRFASDICGSPGVPLDTDPVPFDDWVRQRATHRNVCFQVWKPGVTDQENPDFWRLLDVRVHYKYDGKWHDDFVNAHDRRGNNRRYVWTLRQDPLAFGPMLGELKLPYKILSSSGPSAVVEAVQEFYFTVNGHELKNSHGQPFTIAYRGYVKRTDFRDGQGPQVLHVKVTCDGMRAGSGAGLFFIDITDQQAFAKIKAAVVRNQLFGAPMWISGGAGQEVLTIGFSSLVPDPDTTLTFVEGLYSGSSSSAALKLGDNDNLTLTLRTRSGGIVRDEASWTFNGCSAE